MKVAVYMVHWNEVEEIATLTMHDGKVRIDSPYKEFKDRLIKAGIHGQYGKHYTIADGEEFLKQMPYQYHGSRMTAKIIEE